MADSVNQLRTTLDELDVVLQTGQEENANAMQELRSDIENLRKLVDNPAGLNQQIDRLSSRVAAIREASSKNAQAIRDAISTAPADQPPPASETSGETVAENASPENASTATIDSTATDITE